MEVLTVPAPTSQPAGELPAPPPPVAVDGATPAAAVQTQAPDLQKAKDLEAQAIAKRKHSKEIAEARKAKDDASKAMSQLSALDSQALTTLAQRWNVPREVAYQRLTSELLGQQAKPPTTEDTVAALRAELDEFKKTSAEKEQAAAKAQGEQLIANAIQTAKGIVAGGGDKYAITKELGQEAAIVYLIQGEAQRFQDSDGAEGSNLSFEQAAEKVEAHLEAEALRVANLAKVKTKLSPSEQKPAPTAKAEIEQALQQFQPVKKAAPAATKTLTNAAASAPANHVPAKKLTAAERFERSLQMIRVVPDPQ